jgi:hypothetical protein
MAQRQAHDQMHSACLLSQAQDSPLPHTYLSPAQKKIPTVHIPPTMLNSQTSSDFRKTFQVHLQERWAMLFGNGSYSSISQDPQETTTEGGDPAALMLLLLHCILYFFLPLAMMPSSQK